jgi:FixJ family two-component response regulator
MASVVRGLLNKQVADELGASEKTIKVHRARVMQKMEAESLADLVRMSEKLAEKG